MKFELTYTHKCGTKLVIEVEQGYINTIHFDMAALEIDDLTSDEIAEIKTKMLASLNTAGCYIN